MTEIEEVIAVAPDVASRLLGLDLFDFQVQGALALAAGSTRSTALVSQLLIKSLVLSLGGAVLGVALDYRTVALIAAWPPEDSSRTANTQTEQHLEFSGERLNPALTRLDISVQSFQNSQRNGLWNRAYLRRHVRQKLDLLHVISPRNRGSGPS